MRSLLRLLVLPLLALAVLSACAESDDAAPGATEPTTTPTATPTPFKGLPDGVEGSMESPAGVVAGDEPGTIWVVTYGSSSNPAVVRQVTAEDQQVTVQVSAEDGKPATMDYVPTTSTLTLPEGVSLEQPITFTLGDFGTVTLPSTEPGTAAWVTPQE